MKLALVLVCLAFAQLAQGADTVDLSASVPKSGRISFKAYSGGSALGTHTLTFESSGADIKVRNEADLTFRVLGIPVYRYSLRAQEEWRDGMFVKHVAQGSDDGQEFRTRMDWADGVGRIVGNSYIGEMKGRVFPTSYWAYPGLQASVWMSTQSGKPQSIKVQSKGRVQAKIKGAVIPTERFDVTGDLNVALWYDLNRQWVKAEFNVQGRLISYELQ